MKKDIHPKYYDDAKITCSCGNVITTGTTQEKIETEICSACHPFYTGKKKLVDSTGRVDRFKQKMAKFAEMKKEGETRAKKQAAAPAKKTEEKKEETK